MVNLRKQADMTHPTCASPECDRPRRKRDWCNAHYQRFLQGKPITGPLRPPRAPICEVEGCDRPHHANGMCGLHCARLRKTGTLADPPPQPAREDSPTWAGDAAAYYTVHKRLRKYRGPARSHACSECGSPALDWAYNHTDPTGERVDRRTGLTYSPDMDHYSPMCRACHIAFDRGFDYGRQPSPA